MSTHDDDFWGDKGDWKPTTEIPRTDGERTSAFDVVRRGWNQLLGSGANPTREHGIVRPDAARFQADDLSDQPIGDDLFDDLDTDYTYAEAADELPDDAVDDTHDTYTTYETHDDVAWDAEFPTVPTPITRADTSRGRATQPVPARSGAVDPLLARVGGLAIISILLVPLILSFGSSGGDDLLESAAITESPAVPSSLLPQTTTVGNATPTVEPAIDESPAVPAETVVAPAPPAEPATPTPTPTPTEVATSQAIESVDESQAATAPAVAEDAATAAVDSPAERVARICAIDYEVVPGDFWIRIADGAGVPLAELLEANGVSASTPIYPGTEICLPAGSTIPPPPATTTTTTTTVAPTTTQATTTTTTTTTTVPPTSGDVQQIIRDVWPDELEDYALEVAYRESRYIPTAKNYCCYGIFQIYWNVHKSWLADLGITSDQQLYDARTNIEAAYELYLRAGGWGPWGG